MDSLDTNSADQATAPLPPHTGIFADTLSFRRAGAIAQQRGGRSLTGPQRSSAQWRNSQSYRPVPLSSG